MEGLLIDLGSKRMASLTNLDQMLEYIRDIGDKNYRAIFDQQSQYERIQMAKARKKQREEDEL